MESKKTEKKKDIGELEKKLAPRFSKILFHPKIQNGELTLLEVLEKTKVKNPNKIIDVLREVIETKIYATIEYYAVAQYTYMQKTNNWTEAGQDRVKLSFIRLLLNISVDKEVGFSDYSKFEEIISEKQTEYLVNDFSPKKLEKIINYPSIELLGKEIFYTDNKTVNRILEIVGASRRLMMGDSNGLKSMIYGCANVVKYGKYDVFYFFKEDMRTPNAVQYIVAVIDGTFIGIRQEVCRYVFYNKWIPIFDYDMFQMESFSTLDEESVAESIKKRVAELYEVESSEAFEKKIDDFIYDMSENLVYHELSHDNLDDGNLSQTELMMADGLSGEGESILSILTEVMTEWLPKINNVSGPIKNMVDVYFKGDQKRAERMLLMYMSDAWFLDTDTTFMYPYNYVMFVLLLKYFKKDKEFDFAGLYKDFDSNFNFLTEWYRSTLSELYVKVKKITYQDEGKKKTFDDMKKHVEELVARIKEDIYEIEYNDEQKEYNFWANFFTQLRRKDKKVLQDIFDFLESKSDDLYTKLMKVYASSKDQEKYGSDVRSYVINKMMGVGFSLEDKE